MDLRSLRYFATVVEQGGITQAARVLYVSQPSLSQAMRQLEDELGVLLLDRSGRAAVPTPEGRRLFALAEQVLAEAASATERVRQVAALEVGRLVVATSATLSVHPLTPLVVAMRHEHPGLEVQIRDAGTPARVLGLLRSGEVEIGVADAPLPEPGWASISLEPEEVVLMRAPDSGWPHGPTVPRDRVADLDIGVVQLDLDSTSPTALTLGDVIGRVRARCAHRAMLWELVRQGTVAAFVGRRTAETVLPWAALHSLDPPLWRPVCLVWREGALSPAGRALVELADRLHEGAGER